MRDRVDGYDHFLERLKIGIKNALIRDWYKCVWIKDNQSLELSKEVYSDIYMAENELRAFISRIMIEYFGIDWHDRPEFYKLKASIEENGAIIKRNVPNFNNIDVNLYTVTLEKLMETVKTDIYSDVMQDSPEMQKLIKERIFATTQLDRMQSALDFLTISSKNSPILLGALSKKPPLQTKLSGGSMSQKKILFRVGMTLIKILFY